MVCNSIDQGLGFAYELCCTNSPRSMYPSSRTSSLEKHQFTKWCHQGTYIHTLELQVWKNKELVGRFSGQEFKITKGSARSQISISSVLMVWVHSTELFIHCTMFRPTVAYSQGCPTIKVDNPIPLVNSFRCSLHIPCSRSSSTVTQSGECWIQEKNSCSSREFDQPSYFFFPLRIDSFLPASSLGGLCLWGFAVQDMSSIALAGCYPSGK